MIDRRRAGVRLAVAGLLSLVLVVAVRLRWARIVEPFYMPHVHFIDWSADKLSGLLSPLDSAPDWMAPAISSTAIFVLSLPVSCLYVWLAAGAAGAIGRFGRRRESN